MDSDSSYADLMRILEAASKREALAVAKSMTLTSTAFDSLIVNSADLGYLHQMCVRDFVPAHLVSGLLSLAPSRLGKRLPQVFKDRRRLVAHLFHAPDDSVWHLIYFDQRDTGYTTESNWKHGPHVHYLSYLWPEHSMRSIVDQMNGDKPHLNGEHIRYFDDHRWHLAGGT